MFITEDVLNTEKDHVEGFAPEVWRVFVSHRGCPYSVQENEQPILHSLLLYPQFQALMRAHSLTHTDTHTHTLTHSLTYTRCKPRASALAAFLLPHPLRPILHNDNRWRG